MANIYSNALLTIAASDTANTSIGFLAYYPAVIFDPFELCVKDEIKGLSSQITVIYPSPDKEVAISMGWSSCLSKRGWVLQERLLSPRVLSFRRDRMAWECNRGCYSDDRHYPFITN
jgi:hypothetical protein